MGLLGGRVVGPIGGAIITIPALIFHEWLGYARGSRRRLTRWINSPSHPQQRRPLEFRPFHLSEHSQSYGSPGDTAPSLFLGNGPR